MRNESPLSLSLSLPSISFVLDRFLSPSIYAFLLVCREPERVLRLLSFLDLPTRSLYWGPIALGIGHMGTDGDSCGAGDSDAVGGSAAVTVHVRCSNGSKFSVQIALDSTVGAFKAALVEKCDVPAEQQRLIYKGRILKDEHTLESYGAWICPLDFDSFCCCCRCLVNPLLIVSR